MEENSTLGQGIVQDNLGLTKREKIFVIAAAILAVTIPLLPQNVKDDWEIVYIIIIVLPLGFMLLTDPERRNKGE